MKTTKTFKGDRPYTPAGNGLWVPISETKCIRIDLEDDIWDESLTDKEALTVVQLVFENLKLEGLVPQEEDLNVETIENFIKIFMDSIFKANEVAVQLKTDKLLFS